MAVLGSDLRRENQSNVADRSSIVEGGKAVKKVFG
jgi:hypothetical protein